MQFHQGNQYLAPMFRHWFKNRSASLVSAQDCPPRVSRRTFAPITRPASRPDRPPAICGPHCAMRAKGAQAGPGETQTPPGTTAFRFSSRRPSGGGASPAGLSATRTSPKSLHGRIQGVSGRGGPATGRPYPSAQKKVAEPTVKPGSVWDNHSSRPRVTAKLKQHTRGRVEPTHSPPIWPCSEWGLPCPATLSPQAVGSYPTVSPLPRMPFDTVRRSVLCCTGRQLALPRRYLALCSVEPGLSSARLPASRLSWPTPPQAL